MGVNNKTFVLGWRKFPTHWLLQLCFPLLKIQQQEKRKITSWRQRRSWGYFNFLIDWRKSPACWPAGDKNQCGSMVLSLLFYSLCPLYNYFKYAFFEISPPLKLKNQFCIYFNEIGWVVLLLTSVIYAVLCRYPKQVPCSTRVSASNVGKHVLEYVCL